jgi:predicted metal-dependent peptidase
MLEAEKQIRRARVNILHKYRYFASIALMPIVRYDALTEVMATDGKTLFFNDSGVSALPYQDIYAITLHEILHCVFMHTFRRKNRKMRYYQFAADYAVNSFIRNKIKLQLPEPHLYDERFKDLTTEEIYEELLKPFENQKHQKSIDQDQDQDQDSDDQNQDDQDLDDQDQDSNDQDQDSDDQDQDQDSDDQDQDQDANSSNTSDKKSNKQSYKDSNNSNNSNNSNQNQKESSDQNNSDTNNQDKNNKQQNKPRNLAELLEQTSKPFGQIVDTPDASIKSESLYRQQLENALTQQSKDYIATSLLETIQKTYSKPERIDWFHILKNHVRDLFNGDYGFHIPNVRYVYSGFYLPSFKVKKINKLSLVIDISGSISQRPKMLNDFFEHIRNIAEDSSIDDIEVITCNTQIVSTFNISSVELMFHNFNIDGGGGTDLRPPFEYYDEGLSPQPDLMIFFTDLDGDVPDSPPNYPVVWVVIEHPSQHRTFISEPFGEAIIYDPPKEDYQSATFSRYNNTYKQNTNNKITNSKNDPIYRLDRKTYNITEIKI